MKTLKKIKLIRKFKIYFNENPNFLKIGKLKKL